jgi:phosphoglycerate dehydrogenase-like enzyme
VLKLGFARTFPASREERVHRHLAAPYEMTHPFDALSNGLITPHVSGWTKAPLEARARRSAESTGRVARRDMLLNLISL